MSRTATVAALGVILLCTNLMTAGARAERAAVRTDSAVAPSGVRHAAGASGGGGAEMVRDEMRRRAERAALMRTYGAPPTVAWPCATNVSMSSPVLKRRSAAPMSGQRVSSMMVSDGGTREGEVCEHRVDLYDAIGGGWGGSTLDVLVNGDVVLSQVTLEAGAGPVSFYFVAATGDEITTVYHAVSTIAFFHYYEIYDGVGLLIGQDGTDGTDYFLVPTGITTYGNCDPPTTGACCYDQEGACDIVTPEECATNGGMFLGLATECSECPCDLECPVWSIPEPEVCGEAVNDGCYGSPYMFGAISCGDTICGTTWTDGMTYTGDADYFQITLDEPQMLTWTVKSEAPVRAAIIRTGVPDFCDYDQQYYLAESVANTDCDEMSLTVEGIEGGIYWMTVTPGLYLDEPCEQEYVATLTCEPITSRGACCVPVGTCSFTSEATCAIWGGIYHGDGTLCEDVTCMPFYCAAGVISASEIEYIGRVKIGTIDNVSDFDLDGYEDYTHLSTDVAMGTTSPLLVVNPPRAWSNDVCGVWIDWNQDFDFDDPSEFLGLIEGWGPFNFNVTPPADAVPGPTRMRIRIAFANYNLAACGDTATGEVEDYTINVVEVEGVCCDAIDGSCTQELPSACDGTYGGPGTTCAGTDCNSNGIDDACDILSGYSVDCNLNGVPDSCEALIDCNGNGILDACDILDVTSRDCNNNGIPDECDISGGLSMDCQLDGVPDECQVASEIVFQWDDGTHETSLGLGGGGYQAWIQHFVTETHETTVTQVRLAYGLVPEGTPVVVYVWQDPTQDGNPSDAQVISWASSTVVNPDLDVLNVVDVPDVSIAGLGTHFFVGAILQHTAGESPSSIDLSFGMGHSWTCGSSVPIDPDQLDSADTPPTPLADLEIMGNWLVRVDALADSDCNDNGYPDDCDVPPVCEGQGCSADCNGNLRPDECEADCNGNGLPDDCDIADCQPGETWCADCNGNGLPDECDLPPYGDGEDCQLNGVPDECEEDCNFNGIPDECDLLNCDGSPWCSDCQSDGVLDECQLWVGGGDPEILACDNGISDNLFGWDVGGEFVWIQQFVGTGQIQAIQASFGSPNMFGSSGFSGEDHRKGSCDGGRNALCPIALCVSRPRE